MKLLVRLFKFAGHAVLWSVLLAGGVGRSAVPSLGTPACTNHQFRFVLHGESKAGYWVLTTTNLGGTNASDWTPVGTNEAAAASRTVDMAAAHSRAFFKVQGMPLPVFRFALAVNGDLDLNGHNLSSDSFDSADPAWSTDGLYDSTKAKDTSDIAAGLGINSPGGLGNALVKGTAFISNSGNIDTGPRTSIGSAAWVQAGQVGIEPGHLLDDLSADFSPVPVPFTGGYQTPASGSYLGTNYAYLLGTDRYQQSSINMASTRTMMVIGQAQLYVPGNFSMSAASRIIIAPGASLKLYVGGTASITTTNGQGIFNQTGNAINYQVFGLSSCSQISLAGGSAFLGVIYAPNAVLALSGATNRPLDAIGAWVAGSIRLDSDMDFHFDENLERVGPTR